MRVIDEKGDAVRLTYRRNASDIRSLSEVIGRCEIDRRGGTIARADGLLHLLRGYAAGTEVIAAVAVHPLDVEIQKSAGRDKGAMDIARG